MNKFDAWKKLRFNVVFHGDDWKNTEMYVEMTEKFAHVGVDVVFLKHTEGISSSALRDKIK
jgi:glycerol-3-phosphate cytidylyltransferase